MHLEERLRDVDYDVWRINNASARKTRFPEGRTLCAHRLFRAAINACDSSDFDSDEYGYHCLLYDKAVARTADVSRFGGSKAAFAFATNRINSGSATRVAPGQNTELP
jgi:hypothetical protein